MTTGDRFTVKQLSERVWCIVEDDRFRQYPFIYIVSGDDRIVVVDTGAGSQSLRGLLERLRNGGTFGETRKSAPFSVVCTHCHFDHVANNHEFSTVMMCGAARQFTENITITSLASSVGATVRPYTVTRWLRSGDKIDLGRGTDDPFCLEVVETPGHTLDGISLVAPWDGRIFVGDLVYPYTAIHCDLLGSNASQFLASAQRLLAIARQMNEGNKKVAEFCATLGLGRDRMAQARTLIEACEGNVREAVDVFLTSGGSPGTGDSTTGVESVESVLSCGHVESSLDAVSSLVAVARIAQSFLDHTGRPRTVEEDSAEFGDGTFSIFFQRS